MPYKARFSRIFLKKEDRLPGDVKLRVVEALREILLNPHVGVQLVGPLKGLWRARVGNIGLSMKLMRRTESSFSMTLT